MAGFGFSCGKSAVEWNVLLYLYWLGVEFTPQFLSRETLCDTLQEHRINKMYRKFHQPKIEFLKQDSRK